MTHATAAAITDLGQSMMDRHGLDNEGANTAVMLVILDGWKDTCQRERFSLEDAREFLAYIETELFS